jgi:hypothetical protein
LLCLARQLQASLQETPDNRNGPLRIQSESMSLSSPHRLRESQSLRRSPKGASLVDSSQRPSFFACSISDIRR